VGDQGIERFARAAVLRALGRTDEARQWYSSLGFTSLDLAIYAQPAAQRMAVMRVGGERAR
jgi:hypothetical protein